MSVFEQPHADTAYNVQRGVVAVVIVFILIGMIHMPNGPFVRPHPAFWRLVLCVLILYVLLLIFMLFQVINNMTRVGKIVVCLSLMIGHVYKYLAICYVVVFVSSSRLKTSSTCVCVCFCGESDSSVYCSNETFDSSYYILKQSISPPPPRQQMMPGSS